MFMCMTYMLNRELEDEAVARVDCDYIRIMISTDFDNKVAKRFVVALT